MKKLRKTRMVALILALVMGFSNMTVFAENATMSDAELTSEETSEEATEETTVETTQELESVPESVTEENASGPSQVLVCTDNPSVFRDGDNILSDYNGVYLLDFANAELAAEAVAFYSTVADFAELNSLVHVAEGTSDENAVVEVLEEDTDALTVLNQIVADGELHDQKTIALIDTGIAEGGVSILGDSGIDDNGHGTMMFNTIKEENADAEVLSIKAFNTDGYAQVSDVYAAVQYAIEKNVGIISFSASKAASADSELIQSAVQEAVSKGITFVGSAGNNNSNVRFFTPGNIDAATIIGSVKEDGSKTDDSNFGDTVDYYVVADSTSVACARFSGMLSNSSITDIEQREDVFKKPVDKTKDENDEKTKDHSYGAYSSWKVEGFPDHFGVDLSNGGAATIYSGGAISYGSWGTTPFSTETSAPTATDFNGVCIQPSLSTPGGTYGITQVTNQTVIDAMYIMYVMYHDPSDVWPQLQGNDMIGVYNDWMGTTSYTDEQKLYVMWHLVMSYVVSQNLSEYSNNAWYLGCPQNVQNCIKAVNDNIFGIYYQYGNHAPDRFKVYILNTDSGHQDIVLWEMEPEAMVRIAKSVRYEGRVLAPAEYEQCVAEFKNSSETAYNLMRNTEYAASYSNTDFSSTSADYIGTLRIEGDIESAGGADNVSNSITVRPNTDFYIREIKVADSGIFALNTTVYGPFRVESGKRINIGVGSVDLRGENEVIENSTLLYDDMNSLPVTIQKSSSDKSVTDGNDNYNPTGITFDVYKETSITGTSTANKVGHFKITDKNWTVKAYSDNGYYTASGANLNLLVGYYYIKETSGSADGSYLIKNDNVKHFLVTAADVGGGTVKSFSFTDPPRTTTIKVHKYSANKKITDINNCYSLEGAVFGVYKTRANATADANRVATITTNASGDGTSVAIPHGDYYVKEVKAPKGYRLNTTIYPVDVKKSVSQTVNIPETPGSDPLRMIVEKKNSDRNVFLKNAGFVVKYYDVQMTTDPVAKNHTPLRTWYFKTDDNGVADYGDAWLDKSKANSAFYYDDNNQPVIPYGTITVQEISAPTGYVIDNTVSVFMISAETTVAPTTTRKNQRIKTNTPIKQAFSIKKLGEHKSGEDRSLAGAGFSACCIYTESGIPVLEEVAEDYEVKEGEIIVADETGKRYLWDDEKCVALNAGGTKELITDENGEATSVKLDYGRYIVRETTIPDNFHPIEPFTVTISENSDKPKELGFFTDESFKAYIKIIKKDSETGESILKNNASFKIWSYEDEAYVVMKTKDKKGKEVEIDSFMTDDAGELRTPEPLFPGKYRIDETENPVGYYTSEPKRAYDVDITNTEAFEEYVTDDGTVTNMGIYTIEVENTPVKGKILVEKKGGNRYYDEKKKEFVITDEPLKDITFDIYADEDIKAPYDAAKVLYKKNTLVTSVVTDKEGKAESEELPLGAYRLEEHVPADYEDVKPVKVKLSLDSTMVETAVAPASKEDSSDDKTDDEDVDNADKGKPEDHVIIGKYVYEKVKVYNKPKEPEIHTTATEEKTKTQFARPEEQVTIVDKVEYKNLVTDGRTYTLKGVLMLKETNELLLVNGVPVTAEKTFKPKEKDGFEELKFTFNASALSGETVVVFENLYDGRKKVAVHTDIDSEKQTIVFPELGTMAKDAATGTKRILVSKETRLIDTIHYKGMMPGTEIRYVGILYDTATNKPLLIDGKEVRTEFVSKTEADEGDVEMEFVFDSTKLSGKSVTVFEYAYMGDIQIAEHEDITSTDQTVSFYSKPDTPKTGDPVKPLAYAIIMTLSAMIGVVLSILKAKSMKKKDIESKKK